jgi:hypothetical protein
MHSFCRSLFVVAIALACFLPGQAAPVAAPAATAPAEGGAIEVRFTDSSNMKVQLRDTHLEIETPYGKLRVPVTDIRRIEFATRLPEDLAKRIDAAIANLGKDDFELRDKAKAELMALKEQAYHALVKVTKGKDLTAARLAQEVLDKIGDSLPEDMRVFREQDILHTDHMKIAGRLATTSLKMSTWQFGEQQVNLGVLHSLRIPGAEPEIDPKLIMPDPGSLNQFGNQVGKRFYIRVTGAVNGGIFGSDVYTADSHLATAAVHAGVLKVGETGVVKVTIVAPPPVYQSTTRNGITSNFYNQYPYAYEIKK